MEVKSQATKRRSWGKSREREKMVIVDQMEIEALTKPTVATTSEKDSIPAGSSSLLHPNLMSDDQLESILREMKVPLLTTTKEASKKRDQLLCLFKKHVVPKPQRTACLSERKGKRKRRSLLQEESDTTSEEDSAMEWTATVEERLGAGNSEQNRKRKSVEQLLPPSTKKPAQPILSPLSSAQPVTGSNTISQAMPPLKRPSIPQDSNKGGKILKTDKNKIHTPQSIRASTAATSLHSRPPVHRPKITWP